MHFKTILGLSALLVNNVNALPQYSNAGGQTTPKKYDYIVIGSGPGGAPLATRLALANYTVLLLDAGSDQAHTPFYQLPILASASTEYAPMKWDFYVSHYSDQKLQLRDTKNTFRTPSGGTYIGSTPPAGSKLLGILYPRAGTLGGCSAHNALKIVYPHRSDWTDMVKLTGDKSWEPEKMRKYFKRIEDVAYTPRDEKSHGVGGWLTTSVSDLNIVWKDKKILGIVAAAGRALEGLGSVVFDSLEKVRMIVPRDLNVDTLERDSAEGVYQIPMSVKDGQRIGPREILLATANAVNSDGTRKYHLDIQLDTLVTKIRFSTKKGSKPGAIGVDYLVGRSLYRADPRSVNVSSGIPGSVDATREVIVSAGAYNTPQLLKLSGVGPSAELKKFGIPVIVNLPGVGTNLQDRVEVSVTGKSNSNTTYSSIKGCTNKTPSDPCYQQWTNNVGGGDRGIYASNGNHLALVKKSSVSAGDSDLIISGAPVNFFGYFPGYTTNASASGKHFSWVIIKAHTRNNGQNGGTVKLLSKDPRDMPQITFNHFPTNDAQNSEKDITTLVEGVELTRKVFAAQRASDGDGGVYEEVWPGKEVKGGKLRQFIRDEAWGHHVSCTCPIGKDDDPMAVLDSSFRVRGTEGLRVVDASVFPKIPGMFIVTPIYMISEKAADVIIADAKKK